jgi:ubiquinone biosynthesis protein UbiJ
MLSHLVSQNEWAKPILLPYASMAVRFVMLPVSATLVVLEDGGLAMAGETAEPDATINLPFSTVIRLLADDAAASNDISIDGHAELAAAIAKVLRNMSWKVEEDLSHLIGDLKVIF